MAAGALLLTMFLPWYEKSVYDSEAKRFASDTVSAFGAISFVEAAIFLVAAGVLALVLARGEGRAFHLPGGDGMVVFAAGLWAALLIFYRVFDRPDISGEGASVGIQWGFFAAFVAAGALAFAGQRIRVAGHPEPVLREESPQSDANADASEEWTEVAPRPRDDAATQVAPKTRRPGSRAVRREDAEQLTFDEPPEPPLRPGEIPPARDRR